MKVCARALFPSISPPFSCTPSTCHYFLLARCYIGVQYPSLSLIVSIKQFRCDSLFSKQQWTVSFILYTVTESIRQVKIQCMVCVQSFYDIQCPTKSVLPVCSSDRPHYSKALNSKYAFLPYCFRFPLFLFT
jgi:hypothetical protein